MKIEIKRNEDNNPTAYIEIDGLEPVEIEGRPTPTGMKYYGTETDEYAELESNSDETEEICFRLMDILSELHRLDIEH